MKQFVKKLLREEKKKIKLFTTSVEKLNKIMFPRYYIADHSPTSTVLDIPSSLPRGVLFDLNLQSSKVFVFWTQKYLKYLELFAE